MPADPYSILGLQPNASADEAKQAFRNLAKTCHPDLHPGDAKAEARFKEINEAYDRIANPKPQQQTGPGANWEFDFGYSPFGDLFSQLHGFQRQDVSIECRISLLDAFNGTEITAQVPSRHNSPPREINVKIPAGVEDGMRIVVQQGGTQAHPNQRPGDLHIFIRIMAHPQFVRNGMTLTTIIPLSVFDILLGKEIEVIGIDGHKMKVSVPANYDSSRKLRLAGQGMRDTRGARGDLLVELLVHYPTLSDGQKIELRKIISV